LAGELTVVPLPGLETVSGKVIPGAGGGSGARGAGKGLAGVHIGVPEGEGPGVAVGLGAGVAVGLGMGVGDGVGPPAIWLLETPPHPANTAVSTSMNDAISAPWRINNLDWIWYSCRFTMVRLFHSRVESSFGILALTLLRYRSTITSSSSTSLHPCVFNLLTALFWLDTISN
jgi:hypothetical protein